MVPVLVDPDGYTPADWWDFDKRYNYLLEHSKVSQEQVVLLGEDCMGLGEHPLPIPKITYERQDQECILTLAQNSCSPGLHMKINHKFRKFLGHRQARVVYLCMMLDIIINITPDVAAGLKTRIKFFGEKSLKGLYPKGENVERLVLDYGRIFHIIYHQGYLPEDAITDVLKGLYLASHE